MKETKGICYLVGAGPGDPGLMTVKGADCLQKAEVVIYDALSSPAFLRNLQKNCELINAGKRAKEHTLSQEEINNLLVEKTGEGKIVVRLKGGDPMIFGRGGEEAAALAEAGLKFEIVPGISSAIGGVAYAGIPVTHRKHGSQLTLFTGHEDPEKAESTLDYEQLAKAPGTKVFLMGMTRLSIIAKELTQKGMPPSTPIALVQWASTGAQKTVQGTLDNIAEKAKSAKLKAPVAAVIGDVLQERDKLNWFENRPLFGKKIVVTRTREQSSELEAQLSNLGAEVIELPTIRIEPPEDIKTFAELVQDCHRYDWLIFTSPNGVDRFFQAFYALYKDCRSLGGARIAAIGPGTAAKIREQNFAVDLLPEKYVAEGLVEAFKKQGDVDNQLLLWVKAAETRDVISNELTKLGGIVDTCVAYRTVPETRDLTGAIEKIQEEGADIITFTSSSTVTHFFELNLPWPKGCKAASIGPVTSATLRKHNTEPAIEAPKHDIPGLVEAILEQGKSSESD